MFFFSAISEYLDEAILIPKNTSVLIRRVPGRPRIRIITPQEYIFKDPYFLIFSFLFSLCDLFPFDSVRDLKQNQQDCIISDVNIYVLQAESRGKSGKRSYLHEQQSYNC